MAELDRLHGSRLPWAARSGLDGLDVELHLHLVADQYTTGLQCDVPLEAEVLAVDLGRGAEAGLGVVPGVDVDTLELEVELDLAGHTVDGEVAEEHVVTVVVLDAGADEGHGGGATRTAVLGLEVEEVGVAEVGVTAGVAGVDRRQ